MELNKLTTFVSEDEIKSVELLKSYGDILFQLDINDSTRFKFTIKDNEVYTTTQSVGKEGLPSIAYMFGRMQESVLHHLDDLVKMVLIYCNDNKKLETLFKLLPALVCPGKLSRYISLGKHQLSTIYNAYDNAEGDLLKAFIGLGKIDGINGEQLKSLTDRFNNLFPDVTLTDACRALAIVARAIVDELYRVK